MQASLACLQDGSSSRRAAQVPGRARPAPRAGLLHFAIDDAGRPAAGAKSARNSTVFPRYRDGMASAFEGMGFASCLVVALVYFWIAALVVATGTALSLAWRACRAGLLSEGEPLAWVVHPGRADAQREPRRRDLAARAGAQRPLVSPGGAALSARGLSGAGRTGGGAARQGRGQASGTVVHLATHRAQAAPPRRSAAE
jgi:hypothetical protein